MYNIFPCIIWHHWRNIILEMYGFVDSRSLIGHYQKMHVNVSIFIALTLPNIIYVNISYFSVMLTQYLRRGYLLYWPIHYSSSTWSLQSAYKSHDLHCMQCLLQTQIVPAVDRSILPTHHLGWQIRWLKRILFSVIFILF